MADQLTPERRAEIAERANYHAENSIFSHEVALAGYCLALDAEVERLTAELEAEREDHNRAKDGWERAAGELRDADERAEKAEQMARAYQQTLEERTRERDDARARVAAMGPGEGEVLVRGRVCRRPSPDNLYYFDLEVDGTLVGRCPRSAIVQFPPAPAPAEGSTELTDDDRLVTVCAECLMATCWHGLFLCDRSRSANIVKKPIRELRALNREHESYWRKEHLEKYGDYNA